MSSRTHHLLSTASRTPVPHADDGSDDAGSDGMQDQEDDEGSDSASSASDSDESPDAAAPLPVPSGRGMGVLPTGKPGVLTLRLPAQAVLNKGGDSTFDPAMEQYVVAPVARAHFDDVIAVYEGMLLLWYMV